MKTKIYTVFYDYAYKGAVYPMYNCLICDKQTNCPILSRGLSDYKTVKEIMLKFNNKIYICSEFKTTFKKI